jgi:hypothetical protein
MMSILYALVKLIKHKSNVDTRITFYFLLIRKEWSRLFLVVLSLLLYSFLALTHTYFLMWCLLFTLFYIARTNIFLFTHLHCSDTQFWNDSQASIQTEWISMTTVCMCWIMPGSDSFFYSHILFSLWLFVMKPSRSRKSFIESPLKKDVFFLFFFVL